MANHRLLVSLFLSIVPALILASPFHLRAAEPADSLGYEAKRRQILEHAPDERSTLILGAAQDLARDGYYAEALDLIYSMQEDDAGKDWEKDFDSVLSAGGDSGLGKLPAGSAAKQAPAYTGYVQASLDYEEWEFLDTLVGGRVRGKLEWDPPGAVDRLTTLFQVSDRNAYFDLSGKGTLYGGSLKLEGDAMAEKKIWRANRDEFEDTVQVQHATGDSLDRLFLQARAEGNSRRFGHPLAVVVPVIAEAELYRHDKPGYYSYRSIGASPGLEAVSDNLLKSLILSWEMRRREYPESPGSSEFRQGPVASGEWYGKRVAFDAETRFVDIAYDRDTSLTRSNRLETRAGLFVRTWPWLKVGLRTVGESETDEHVDNLDVLTLARYSLEGAVWSVQPKLVAEWSSAYSASLGLNFTRGDYPIISAIDGQVLLFPLYQNYSADDWKAEAGFSILSKAIFFTLSVDYEENWVAYPQIYRQGSSKGFGLNGNLFWKLHRWIELDVSCDATRRTWLADGYTSGNISNAINLSVGLMSRFP